MKTQQKGFRTWNEFINFNGPHCDRVQMLRFSLLILGSPATMRQLVWVSIVDPDFAGECLKFYRKCPLNFELPRHLAKRIEKSMQKPFPAILQEHFNEANISKILNMFAIKRPDIGFVYGMQYVASIFNSMFIVETDAFILFCYVYENLYPPEFFSNKNRCIGLHQELRILTLMAEKMRPKLANCLKAVFKQTKSKETDSSAFVTLIKNIADVWFKTLFTTVLPYKALLRFFDTYLLLGIEFLHKFSLAYLSKKESFIINSIKTETKGLKLGTSVEALIISGNITKSKLLYKAETFDIESLIKKCLKKDTYKALNRFDYLSTAVVLETKSSERIARLKKCKSLLSSKPLLAHEASSIISAFSTDQIYRVNFNEITQRVCTWDTLTSNSIYTLFDQNGEEVLEKSTISIGICLLVSSGIDEKLQLCFQVFDIDNSGFLSSMELADMIIEIEKALDGRSSFYQRESENMMNILDSNKDSKISLEEFIKTVKSHKLFLPIIDFIQLIIADEDYTRSFTTIAYEEIHSPISKSGMASDESESDNLVERNIYEAEVEYKVPEFVPDEVENEVEIEKVEKLQTLELNEKVASELLFVKPALEVPEVGSPIKLRGDGNFFSSQEMSLNEEQLTTETKKPENEEEVNRHNNHRSEPIGSAPATKELEYSISAEYQVEFPEVQSDFKERECPRLCSKNACDII